MEEHKIKFLKMAIEMNVLQFGRFKLKSGRQSPYFFNAGLFNTGESIAALGQYYADTIISSNINFDMIFGPAYKGIPIATSTASALSRKYNTNKPFAYNRKEQKKHGEQGLIVGSKVEGKVLIVDDVITAGTAVKEAYQIIKSSGANVAGLVVSIDRQEIGSSDKSAIQELQENLNIPVVSIAILQDLINHIETSKNLIEYLSSMKRYQSKYCSI